jgi:hypothetical protein
MNRAGSLMLPHRVAELCTGKVQGGISSVLNGGEP